MTTATKSKTARKPVARSAKVQTIGTSTVLWLTVDKNVTAYRVLPLPHQFGKAAFQLEKADKGDGQPESYAVLLDGNRSTCECLGHLKHGHCKHTAGLAAVLASGALPQPEPSEEEETIELTEQPPQPADERDNYCPTCGCLWTEHVAGFCPR